VHYPMLDPELLEFSCSIEPTAKLRNGNLRHFFKKSVQDFLPQEIIMKSKHGFGLPFGIWLTKSQRLQNIFDENLRALRLRKIFQPDFIDRLTKSHQTEHASYYGNMLWVLGMLEQWLNTHRLEVH
ncbi:MAG: asparagine synthase-related protein, partial [Pseudomonadota bacterium]